MNKNVCATKLIITGIVQGIGYRYFVQKVAEEENVFGYVKNNFDGSVEIVAECYETKIFEKFLSRIMSEHPYAVVKNIEMIKQPVHNYSTFSIKY
ncbi:MAG: acylphosphatase [Endomicrobiia bacterium]